MSLTAQVRDVLGKIDDHRIRKLEHAACDRGRGTRQDAAACVLYSSEKAMEQAVQAVQAMGGAGFLNDAPVSRSYASTYFARVFSTTSAGSAGGSDAEGATEAVADGGARETAAVVGGVHPVTQAT